MGKFKKIFIIVLVLGISSYSFSANKKKANTLPDIVLKNSKEQLAKIPDFGKKLLVLVYSDYEGADANEPIAALGKEFGAYDYRGIAIANLRDNPKVLADDVVCYIIKQREVKYGVSVLIDDNYTLRNSWQLGDCNDHTVVMIVGKDKCMKFMAKVGTAAEAMKIRDKIKTVVSKELKIKKR